MSVSEFLSMGGYGFYVWGSYLVALIAFAAELISLSRRKKALSPQPEPRPVIRGSITNETTS
jgi:heme exporter protein D